MNDPNTMEPIEIGRGIETGFKMLTDSSFSAVVNAEGIADLKKLLRLLLQGVYSVNTTPEKNQPSGLPIEPGKSPADIPPSERAELVRLQARGGD